MKSQKTTLAPCNPPLGANYLHSRVGLTPLFLGIVTLASIACNPERKCEDSYDVVEGGGLNGKRYGVCQPTDTETDTDTTTMGETTTTDSSPTTTEDLTTTTTTTEPTTSTTTEEPTTTTGDPPCNYDLVCDREEDLAGCLHDCATCDDNGRCDPTSETPYSCPGDCPATDCNLDGVINALSEQCDDGEMNSDTAKCKDDCSLNICGDGALHEGVEECDDGNLVDGDGCSSTCTIEERLVFISSKKYEGDLGGLKDADQECQTLADQAELPGTYQAWLSDSTTSAATRLNLQNFTGELRLTDENLVATGWAGLISGTLQHAINIDEAGMVQNDKFVWTHTKPDGTAKSGDAHCENWTDGSSTPKGHTGLSKETNSQWTDTAQPLPCNSAYHLYCIQTAP